MMRVSLLVLALLNLKSVQGIHGKEVATQGDSVNDWFECTLHEVQGIPEKDSPIGHLESQISCIDEIDGSSYFFRNVATEDLKGHIEKGETRFEIEPKIRKQEMNGIIDSKSIKKIEKRRKLNISQERKLFRREGIRTVLAVRITSAEGHSPTYNPSALSNIIFGTIDDENNLRSGYSACSGGKLDMAPLQGLDIQDGVIDLAIAQNVTNVRWKTVQNYAISALTEHNIFVTDVDNIMLILPPQVDFEGAAGWAYLSYNVGVFKDTYVRYQLVLMHELGHNLGFRHSGDLTSSYGDKTCFMGGSVWAESTQMCFNAAKSWYSGWYYDRHFSIEPMQEEWSGELVGIDDYVKDRIIGHDRKVILKINGVNEVDIFAMFNRKKGINRDVAGFSDQVTIVTQEGETSKSVLVGGLKDGETFRFSNWSNSSSDLVIQDCGHAWEDSPGMYMNKTTIDYALLRVFIDNGTYNLQCDQPFRACQEKGRDRFLLKLDVNDQPVTRQCKWISKRRLDRQKDICNQEEGQSYSYGLARDVCCNTCAKLLR